ncbi:MAG TPA: dTDP-glucose 4,6-dehydratase [Planctomycetota bacterium]|nr:dTDP-glucose 4,6-dehydratase [Planctomycetota bacterium]
MRVLVTGGQGFIGSNLVRLILAERPGWRVFNVDNYSYAGAGNNLEDLEKHERYQAVRADVADKPGIDEVFKDIEPEAVLHLAAESHVDRSILESGPFVRTNVEGTRVMLEAARAAKTPRFVHVSTDEVYGDLGPTGKFTEETPLAPNSPYSASKASSDLLARAFFKTYKLPVVTTRCSNNYGPYQFPEKLIPLMISNALEETPLPVYGDGKNARDWIHVEDHCRGILAALEQGKPGEVYNFGGDAERENIFVVKRLLELLGKPESLIRYVTDRPGHDRRYAIDASKAKRELGWAPRIGFEDGLARTVAWYRANEAWWKRLKDPKFADYYHRQYGAREARQA